MPGARGGKRDYKPRRGGGKSFSRNLQPLDADGNETNTPDRYEPRSRRNQEDAEGEDEDGSGSEGSGSSGSESDSSEDGLGSVGAPKPKKDKSTVGADANPNRASQKSIKASDLGSTTYEPSRKEREAAEKKAAQEKYWKLHQAGKTDQAKADLARLKVIREKREAAAKAREQEKAQSVEDARAALEKGMNIGRKS